MKRFLVVYKKSSFEMYRSSADQSVRDFALQDAVLQESHRIHAASLEQVLATLDARAIEYQKRYRSQLQPIDTSLNAVVVVGGDGTTLDTAHYVPTADIPIIGVNSDPAHSVGFYTCCTADNFADFLDNLKFKPKTSLPRLEVILNGQSLPYYVLNDIFIAHSSPAAYTRYMLTVDGKKVVDKDNNERLRSSGIVIATASGSTAWMYNLQGTIMPLTSTQMQYKERDVRNLTPQYAEREIKVQSLTREGRIFVDGDHLDCLFSLGDCLIIKVGSPVQIVGDINTKRQTYEVEAIPRALRDQI